MHSPDRRSNVDRNCNGSSPFPSARPIPSLPRHHRSTYPCRFRRSLESPLAVEPGCTTFPALPKYGSVPRYPPRSPPRRSETMARRTAALLAGILFLLVLPACKREGTSGGKPQVAVSIFPLFDIARRVAG